MNMAADGAGMNAIEILRKRAAEAKAEAERERLSAEDKEEAALRQDIARDEATAREKDREALALVLARHEDAAREALGAKVPVKGILSEDGTHGFVLRYAGSKAFAAWENGITLSHLGSKDPRTQKKVDRAEANKTFALLMVHTRIERDASGKWVGHEIAPGTDGYARLATLFDEFGGIASTIALTGRDLAQANMEERKS